MTAGGPASGGPASGEPASKVHTVLCIQPVAEEGGSDQALLRLVAQLGRAGWQVHVALPEPSPMTERFARAGAQLHVVPMRRVSTSHGLAGWALYALNWPLSVARLWLLCRRCHAELVHTNSLHSWYGWAVARLAGLPHVWHAREIVTQSGVALGLERALCRRFATVVLAASQAIADQLPGAPLQVVYEEVDPAEYFPQRAGRARRRLGLDDRAPLVGYVGRVDTWKGVEVLLEAKCHLDELRPGTALVVAGAAVKGKEAFAADLQARAAQVGARWAGPLPGPEAADLIADLDVLAYPSTGPEPWGLALVEAMACGVPVVATDAGGPREMLAGSSPSTGRLVPPGDAARLADAICELLPRTTDAESRKRRSPLRRGALAPYPELFARALSGRGTQGRAAG